VQKEKKKKRIILIIIIAFFAIVLILCITVLVIRASDRKIIKQIREYDKKAVRYTEYGNYDKALEEYEQAEEIVNKLNMDNWQYTSEKKELSETVSGRKFLTGLIQEAEAAFTGQDYKQAEKIYKQAQKEAAFQGLGAVEDEATEKLVETDVYIQVSQYVALGGMYASAGEYEEAVKQYEKVLELLNKVNNIEMQAEIQAKIFDAHSKQKQAEQEEEEAEKAEEEAKQKKEEKKKQEKEEKKQHAANKQIIQMNTLITSAGKALEEGRTKRAEKLYKEVLSKYNSFSGSAEDAESVYADITALGQAITEAKAKAEEEAEQKKLTLASKYILQAKEASRTGKKDKAIQLYEKALKVYKEMDIWDERPEAVYEALEELENEES
ncbi:MAG: tetratricopeptide repeat protein, partial [Lachnospiraceae bacterium]|nr:tetratricopeptide repeat protein [Lachnospiraceae bacterium]